MPSERERLERDVEVVLREFWKSTPVREGLECPLPYGSVKRIAKILAPLFLSRGWHHHDGWEER